MPKLGAIVCYGTGYDGVDLAAAAKRNIAVANSPGANAASVADIAVTLMLAVTRRLLPADDYVRSGGWSSSKPSPLMRPQPGNPGRRVGVYGMGEIGRKIAARVAAFETDVAYYSRSRHDVPYQYMPSLEALADWCSVLMIAVRAGADTHHAVNAGILKRLGEDGTVVNISQGVCDRPAGAGCGADRQYHRRRRSRRVRAGAACAGCADHAPECGADPAYRRPHPGSHTAMQDCVIANLEAFFRRQAAAVSGATSLKRAVSGQIRRKRRTAPAAHFALGKAEKTC